MNFQTSATCFRYSRYLAVIASGCLCVSCIDGTRADFPRVLPTPPEKAEATFEVQHGFRMQLIAAEPLVVDPVDLAYDENGRAYVVEMRDYPYPEEKNAAPTVFPGTVRLLEDTDDDGSFDKSTVFADQLAWPTSVCCYRGGVFVAAAPDIWYFKDTDGDRQADIRRKAFTGFSRYNVQAIMNSLRWGLDNKIYGAAAGNGGTVRHAEKVAGTVPVPAPSVAGTVPVPSPAGRNDNKDGTRSVPTTIQLTRRDFRFDPVTEKIEAIAGGERYGACFDDFGNRFLCNIRNPVQHAVLPLHYVQRNPHLIAPSLIHDCAQSGDQLRVFRISPPEPWRQFRAERWSLEGANMPRSELIGAGYWTSSSGVTVYRGGAYPEPFRGNVFIGEVAGNLIHRQILERDGVTFKSRRADENTEFVRSRDNWFRPANFVNAPDGTLTVLDMYRETIEHPWSIPDDIKAQLDLTSGNNRGRLYRLAPPGFTHSKSPKLGSASTAQLVAHLESPHSWVRETAQRLLFERQATDASAPLRKLLSGSASPQARIHALCLLEGLGQLEAPDILRALRDSHPEVRRRAVVLAESRLDSAEIKNAVLKLVQDSQLAVRCQVALSLGTPDDPQVAASLTQLAASDGNDPWMRTAILSSLHASADALLKLVLLPENAQSALPSSTFIKQLAYLVGAGSTEDSVLRTLNQLAQPGLPTDNLLPLVSGLGEGLSRKKRRLSDYVVRLDPPARDNLQSGLTRLTGLAADRSEPVSRRVAAIELRAIIPVPDNSPTLAACLDAGEPREIQQAALKTLGLLGDSTLATELLARWKQMTPPIREEAVNVLQSRPIWHEPLIAAMESGDLPVSQISIPQRARLAAIKDQELAPRVKNLLEKFVLGSRKDVVDRYQQSLALQGDQTRGQTVYHRECANCHRLRGEGHEVGPSLETIQHRSPQEILIHVLDPNREVSPNYLEYVIRLTDGRVLIGLISSDTDAGLTLKRAQNQEETVPRAQIEEMASSGKSLMPEGVEQKVSLQEMADLIAFLKSN